MFKQYLSVIVLTMVFCSAHLYADIDVQEFTDAQAWQDTVGSYSTIDFTGGEHMTPILDDYQELFGITFDDTTFYHQSSAFPNDGWGFRAPGGSWLDFAEPQMWIAADHPGTLHFDLFYEDELIYSSNEMGGSGAGHFSGLLSSQPFDQVYLYRVAPLDNLVFVDDLHFGTIAPAPGALGVFALAALCARSRRRTVRTAS